MRCWNIACLNDLLLDAVFCNDAYSPASPADRCGASERSFAGQEGMDLHVNDKAHLQLLDTLLQHFNSIFPSSLWIVESVQRR